MAISPALFQKEAVDRYQPYLLPLIPDGARRCVEDPAIRTPLDEERVILDLAISEAGIWDALAETVRRTHGLPLILDSEGRVERRKDRPFAPSGTSPRCLILFEEKRTWFLLNHPDDLSLFDQLAQPNERPALARPSLFMRLWRQADGPEASSVREAVASYSQQDGQGAALQAHLARLLHPRLPSDWHLEPVRDHWISRLRIDGVLGQRERLSREQGDWLVNLISAQAGMPNPGNQAPADGRMECRLKGHGIVSLRISRIPALHGPALVIRFMRAVTEAGRHDIRSLGLDAESVNCLNDVLAQPEGLCLVVGPTGSGKTTTLHALLTECVLRDEKVMAVEDPVERVLPGVQHLSVGRPPGLTYARAMRAFLRQAPDTILIGEIRDAETAAIALQSGRTGHRILSTLHAGNDAGVIRRFEDLGQPADALLSVVQLILHQRLLPRLCPHCRLFIPFPEAWQHLAEPFSLPVPDRIAEASQCHRCTNGQAGRLPLLSPGSVSSGAGPHPGLRRQFWKWLTAGEVELAAGLGLFPSPLRVPFQLCQA